MGSRAAKTHIPPLTIPSETEPAPDSAMSYGLRPLRYNAQRYAWEALDPKHVAAEGHKLEKSSLRMVTYNVFFGQVSMRERFRNILGMLPELDADIICLQEVNREWIEEMTDNEYVQKNFYASDVDCRTFNGYGVVLLSRIPMVDLTMWRLPTQMGRSALVATFHINGEQVSVATVHMESLDSAPIRRQQMEKIAQILASSPNAALMGDFNFDSDRNFSQKPEVPLENESLAALYPEYADVWPTLRPDEKGYTFDSEVNRMIRQYEQMRYDRVMWKSASGSWRPERIELVGTKSLRGNLNVWPSDHFGLVTDLVFTDTIKS